MNKDLKIIKKKYGERMSKLCRELFPAILETEGLLPQILISTFNEDHNLYEDIINNNKETDFKNYIYELFDFDNDIAKATTSKTPQELLNEAGYNLYKCETERDIQYFKKYYAPGEELCTFKRNRLNSCYVYFAVKKDADNIKRKNFPNPKRQDLYGTSVISIQFTKDETHTLSIKNRYNHTVSNPDATFSNNLDNIIPGLTEAFAKHEGMEQSNLNNDFEIPGYVRANDGRYYKYNYEIDNVYYCPNNIIIDNFKVQKYNPDKYLIVDYFILDLQNKKITNYNEKVKDSFIDTLKNIQKISINTIGNNKEIQILTKDGTATIIIDKNNNIISYENNFIEEINDHFISFNNALRNISLPKVTRIGSSFCENNECIENVNLNCIKYIEAYFLSRNTGLKSANFPNLETTLDNFMSRNKILEELNVPNLRSVGNNFLCDNNYLRILNTPYLNEVGSGFLIHNEKIEFVNFSSLETAGNYFMLKNKNLENLFAPNLRVVGSDFLSENEIIKTVIMPNVEYIGKKFLKSSKKLAKLIITKVQQLEDDSLLFNEELKELDLSNCKTIGKSVLRINPDVRVTFSNDLLYVGENTLKYNNYITIKQTERKPRIIHKKSIMKKKRLRKF